MTRKSANEGFLFLFYVDVSEFKGSILSAHLSNNEAQLYENLLKSRPFLPDTNCCVLHQQKVQQKKLFRCGSLELPSVGTTATSTLLTLMMLHEMGI